MQFGIDLLVARGYEPLSGKRLGLFTNLAAVNRDMVTTYTLFSFAPQLDLRALFSPEHGLGGMVPDGAKVDSEMDVRTGLPVYSLYGDALVPTAEMLAEIDLIVCDIQDIGVRYYTFLWTLTHILEACGSYNVEVMVLDRPNPLGDRIDGGRLAPELSSLVGRFSIPIQHGMSWGEVANMVNDLWNPTPAQLQIIACEGWHRSMTWAEIDRPFVPPSPNMPHFSTTMHYPGACLIEGTTLSEGRGTGLPFEVVGAPYIDAITLATTINAQGISGAIARPHYFQPTDSKFGGQACSGIQLHITNYMLFRPLTAWLKVLKTICEMYPQQFSWLPAHRGIRHFDRLIGDKSTRKLLEGEASVEQISAKWSDFHSEFLDVRQPYLIYGET